MKNMQKILGKLRESTKIETSYGSQSNKCKKLNNQHICVAFATGLTRKPLIFQPNADCSSTRQMARLGAFLHGRLAVPLVRACQVRALSFRGKFRIHQNMQTINGKNLGLVFLTAILFHINFQADAQPVRTLRPGTNSAYALLENPALTNSPGAIATIKEVLATTPAAMSVPVLSLTNHSESGTYWTMQSPVPLPNNFFPDLPVYLLDATNRTFLIDDRSVDYATLDAQIAAENATNGSEIRFTANDLIIDTNHLWLSVATNALPGSDLFNVVIHTTVTGNYYDVLTKTDLLLPLWTIETNVIGAPGDETPVTLAQNDRTNLFVWARDSIIPIYTQPLPQEVFSGDSVTFTVGAGGSGLFYQWTFDGTNIFGATGSSYTIDNVNPNNAGDYACIIHNADGSVTTQTATLTVDQGSGWPYDMSAVGQRQDYTFRSGVTYDITSPIQLFGKTTIEAGAIIKFDYNGFYPCLQIMGTLDCEGTPYNPAVLTTVDDDTFGLQEQDSTGSPQSVFTGAPYLDLTYAGNVSLSNMRFRYADMAVGAPYFSRVDVWDCQFVQCYASVVNEFGGMDGFHNVLFAGCYDAVAGDTNAYAIEMEQVTADVSNVWDSSVSPSSVHLTNSIIFGNIGSVSGYSAQNVTVGPNPTDLQTNGAGNYYLAASSSLRQAGTTNISSRLRTELQQKTTTPPIALPQLMNLAGDLTLLPQVGRYTNGLPDRGYYYDVVDYTVAFLTVSGSLTVEPGTVLGIRNEPNVSQGGYTSYGLDLRENSSFVSHGSPNRPNIITDVQNVQEQDEYGSSSLIVPDFMGASSDAAPSMDLRFCKLYASAGNFAVWGGDWEFVAYGDNLASEDSLVNWTMRDCEVHGGRISLGLPDINLDLTQYYGSGVVDWENNLFEDVNINLNPATWWYNGVVNFDESLTARNNMFKGANWVEIEPVPANAGNWTLTDNLFDGIDFQTDPAAPLDFDYNGYYPLPVSQELYNTLAYQLSLTAGDSTSLFSATNDLGGLHEVYLDYALPYGSGPFGKYYLTSITSLWQAGSRTASDADLSQYTTSTTESKDAASYPVNIGYHYVAATNSLPLDSDGDGIPDYTEVEHGTDPNNAMTDGTTPDAYNAAYDNVDLSGDGLVGRVKAALGMNPLDPSNPLQLNQVTLGGEPDVTTFEIPISYSTVTNIGTFHLMLNGAPAVFDNIAPAADGNTLLVWSAVYDPSQKTYDMQAQLALNSFGDDHAIMSGLGTLSPFYYDNDVQYFQSDGYFDDNGAYLDAQLPSSFAGQNVNYTVQIFDPSTSPETLIKGITNSTSNGMIQENWDLTYDDGVSVFTGASVDAVYTIDDNNTSGTLAPNIATAQKPHHRPMPRQNITETVGQHDGFDFTYMYTPSNGAMIHEFDSDNGGDDGAVWLGLQNVVDNLISPPTASNGGNSDYYTSGYNFYTSEGGNNHGNGTSEGFPGYIGSMDDLTNSGHGLFKDLTNGVTKNFFCYAHGNDGGMACYAPSNQSPSVSIRAYSNWGTGPGIGDMLLNYSANGNSTNGTPGLLSVHNPFRFVFMDGCDTASGWQWRSAFGIYPLYLASQSAARYKLGPQAYVGWAASFSGWFNETDDSDNSVALAEAYANTLNNFYEEWMLNIPLDQCIAVASRKNVLNTAPFPVPQNGKDYHFKGTATINGFPYDYDFTSTNNETSKIYISGHPGLTRSGLNQSADNDTHYTAPMNIQ